MGIDFSLANIFKISGFEVEIRSDSLRIDMGEKLKLKQKLKARGENKIKFQGKTF